MAAVLGNLHISSLVVHVAREALPSFAEYIQDLPNSEIAVMDEDSGKCVVVLERSTLRSTESAIDAMKVQAGVMAVTLVYHHSESVAALSEPLVASA